MGDDVNVSRIIATDLIFNRTLVDNINNESNIALILNQKPYNEHFSGN